jgi:hypothetical protein
MSSRLVRPHKRRQVEGAHLVGYVQIFQAGEFAICDDCEKPKPLATGFHVKADGLAMIWLCEDCK